MKHTSLRQILSGGLAVALLASASASAATYTSDFSGLDIQGAPNGALTIENSADDWAVVGGRYVNTVPTTVTASTALQPLLGATPKGDFSISTDFVSNQSNTGTFNYGLLAFATTTTVGASSGVIQADVNEAGRLRLNINNFNDASLTLAAGAGSNSTGGLVNGSTYRMTLDGIYNPEANTLGLTFTVTGPDNYLRRLTGAVSSAGVETIESTVNNDYFGLRTFSPNSAQTVGTYDNFSASAVVVPEPSTALSLLGGAAMLSMIRRRRA
jgi:hypothetical protein